MVVPQGVCFIEQGQTNWNSCASLIVNLQRRLTLRSTGRAGSATACLLGVWHRENRVACERQRWQMVVVALALVASRI